MLDLMRRHAGSWIIKAIMAAVALTFVGGFLFLPGLRKGFDDDGIIAEVDGIRITKEHWQKVYQNMVRNYRNMYKEKFTEEMIQRLGLERKALDGLIDRILATNEAERLGIRVSDAEVRDAVYKYPAFQRDGRFDMEMYQRLLSYNRLSPAEFETSERERLVLSKLEGLIRDGVRVSDEELYDDYSIKNDKVNLEFLELNPMKLERDITPSEEELKEYFDAHSEEFKVPPKVKVEYLTFKHDKHREEVEVTEEDVEEYYDLNSEKYAEPEKIEARHILIKTAAADGEEEKAKKRAKIESLLAQARGGVDFSLLATQHSEDAGTAKKGGDLGFFERGKMVPQFDEAAFALKPGEISDVVESRYGFHIIKVDDYAESHIKTLDEVKEEINKALSGERATRLAKRRAEAVQSEVLNSGDLASYVEGEKVVLTTSDFFTAGDAVPGIGRNPKFFNSADVLSIGGVSEVIPIRREFVIVKLLERVESRPAEFEEVKDKVEREVKKEKAASLARERAEAILEELKGGKSMDDVATEDVPIKETGLFSRERDYIPKVGMSTEIKEAAFHLTGEKTLIPEAFEIRNRFIIVRLKEREVPDRDAFEAEKERLRADLIRAKQRRAMEIWKEGLRDRAVIKSSLQVEPEQPFRPTPFPMGSMM